ncbi:hypothetical protein [Massilia pseudoviolaceinigra]|uniref:hypothetical protein n=1 Tax=Massilia pseudoviolaceinigra TaxID=3057165 RepID=UPI0027968919|nr:hypothetical protein [Massilia sp. CCM 9206]MDQ1925047.1 hypothetical protein [Massilia sp. CCM 9206]
MKHAYNDAVPSTKNKTQFGENINVRALRQDTIDFPDSVSTDAHGITKYVKEYPFNISTPDSPTGQMRVFVNGPVPDKSTQFPLFLKPKK